MIAVLIYSTASEIFYYLFIKNVFNIYGTCSKIFYLSIIIIEYKLYNSF